MFGFLKKKLKDAISRFSKKVEKGAAEKPTPEQEVAEELEEMKEKREKPRKKEAPKKEEKPKEEKKEAPKKEKPKKKEEIREEKEKKEKAKEVIKEEIPVVEEKPKGFFQKLKQKIITSTINTSQFEEMFSDMEIVLMENNVAVDVIEKIKDDLSKSIVDKPIPRKEIAGIISKSLRESIEGLFEVESFDLVKKIREKKEKPFVVCFVGVNGSGKTTTIAKVAQLMLDSGLTPVLAAADTFRAAAIDQLQTHADRLGVKMIRQDYGSDAAAVAFDAVEHAKAKERDVVLIDTAGRMHSNKNLMDEVKKIVRVAKPDAIIFVGESITGNDCVDQAQSFDEAVGIDGIILSKADVDEKGGAAISISYVTGKPILYIGTGQEYPDLKAFDPSIVIESIGI